MTRLLPTLLLAAMAQAVAAQPPAWQIVPEGSRLGFTATYDGVPFDGRFEHFRGKLRFAPDQLTASRIDVHVDVTSVNTHSSERDTALANERWFDFERHPEAHFVAQRFERLDNGSFRAHAELTIKGVARKVALIFRWRRDGDRAHLTGETTLSRTAFKIGEGEWADAETIGDEVTVKADVRLRRIDHGTQTDG